jgi:hypothetical protein
MQLRDGVFDDRALGNVEHGPSFDDRHLDTGHSPVTERMARTRPAGAFV